MTKPANFPDRKRRRQITALSHIKPVSKKGKSNADEITNLKNAINNPLPHFTKKDRSATGRFERSK